jgi:hypothetical protein
VSVGQVGESDSLRSSQGQFFQVDQRIWHYLCDVGMNAAVVYLVFARFSARDNATTKASVNAIEKYTGISRGRAKKTINILIEKGVVRQDAGGTKPKYYLRPAHDIARLNVHSNVTRAPMTEEEAEVYKLVQIGPSVSGAQRKIARKMVKQGWLAEGGNGYFRTCEHETKAETPWIWLPNELVSGAAEETPPVELVRQTQDVMTLRLLVDFYHAQNLADDGGVSRNYVRQEYERMKIGEAAHYDVWGFRSQGTKWVTWEGPSSVHYRNELTDEEKSEGHNAGIDFFRRLERLVDLGLIEWMPYLFDGDGGDAEPIHPYGIGMRGTLEGMLWIAAHNAGHALLQDGQRKRANQENLWLAPVPRHMGNVQMIGIARLRYRAKTKLTAAWWQELQTKGKRYLEKYDEIIDAHPLQAPNQ